MRPVIIHSTPLNKRRCQRLVPFDRPTASPPIAMSITRCYGGRSRTRFARSQLYQIRRSSDHYRRRLLCRRRSNRYEDLVKRDRSVLYVNEIMALAAFWRQNVRSHGG